MKQFGRTFLEVSMKGKYPTFTLVVKIEKGVERETESDSSRRKPK